MRLPRADLVRPRTSLERTCRRGNLGCAESVIQLCVKVLRLMTALIEADDISMGSLASSKALRLGLIFVVLCALQIVLYLPTFSIQPYADDFSVSTELQRGRELGTWALFRQSNVDNYYRPFRSVIMYWMGSLPGASPVFWIHVSNAVAMLALAAVTCLWLCTIPGFHACGHRRRLVLLLHPALPQSYASVDSVDSIFSTAFLWLGAWVVFRWPGHPVRSALIASALFLLGGRHSRNTSSRWCRSQRSRRGGWAGSAMENRADRLSHAHGQLRHRDADPPGHDSAGHRPRDELRAAHAEADQRESRAADDRAALRGQFRVGVRAVATRWRSRVSRG